MNRSTQRLPVLHISRSLLTHMSIKLVMPSNQLILCCPLFLLPSIIPSIRVFSNKLALPIRWPKYWSFNISPSSEYLQLISFRMDWFDLLASQRILKSLLQHHNLKASILQSSKSKLCILLIQKNLHLVLLSTSNSVRLWGNQDVLCIHSFMSLGTELSSLHRSSEIIFLFLVPCAENTLPLGAQCSS